MAKCNALQTQDLVAKDCATWPDAARDRWMAKFGVVDDIRGPIWSRPTQYERGRVFTRYLTCVRVFELEEAITPEGIRAFIRDNESRNVVPRSIAGEIWKLYYMACFLNPGKKHHFAWLREAASRINHEAEKTEKGKNAHIVTAEALSALGFKLMAEARETGPVDWPAIQQFRDGLFLAFGAVVPERRRALASMTIAGLGLQDRFMTFDASVIKAHRDSERTYPEDVARCLVEWIEVFRAVYTPDHDYLWIAKSGSPAAPETLAIAMRKITEERLKIPLTPQRFRDAVGTTIVCEGPEVAPLATVMLDHTTPAMTRNYTHTAGQIAASREGAKIIAEGKEDVCRRVRAETRSEIALNPRRRQRRGRTGKQPHPAS